MSNHYHLVVETPKGNLVEGMGWLQSTFANRFNRFRGENGHVFQGRYKALILSDEAQQERLGFARMCWGWAKGDAAFKKRVLSMGEDGKKGRELVESETAEIGSYRWEESLHKLMDMLGKDMEDLKTDRKGADWKVALAIHLRKQYQVPHRWLAHNLSMGKPSSVQSWVSNKREDAGVKIWLQKLKNYGILN